MIPMDDERLLRIIDANANRTREALRVVEDMLRFWREDGPAVPKAEAREAPGREAVRRSGAARAREGLSAQATRRPIPAGTRCRRSEATRRDVGEILVSNFRRAEEGLRVLEEVAKLVDAERQPQVQEVQVPGLRAREGLHGRDGAPPCQGLTCLSA